ncbi:MAG TPA: carbamoyltransferase C-terminal domain-containing protein [bacterium]|nr:carbamoyltransferase C-terminal domain-containing protein [bacterium]
MLQSLSHHRNQGFLFMDDAALHRAFQEILHYAAFGNINRAIQLALQHFVGNADPIRWLESQRALEADGDVIKIFALAFLRSGDTDRAQALLDKAFRRYRENEDLIRLNQASCLLQKGNCEAIFPLLAQISAESLLMPDVRNVLSEATRLQQDKANDERIKALARKVRYDPGEYYILGMKPIGHDTHVSIVDRHGAVVFEAEEERFIRKKHAGNLPLHSILAGLRQCSIHPAQVRYIAFSFSVDEYTKAASQWEAYYRQHNLQPKQMQMVRAALVNAERYRIQERYFKSLFPNARVYHVKHHLAHCAGAFYSSPFRRSAILSVDGHGEFETVMLARGENDRIEQLKSIGSPHSLGTLYQSITYWLGLGSRQEGKTMGLSSYGDPTVYYKHFRDHIINIDLNTGLFEINPEMIDLEGVFIYDHTRYDAIFDLHHKMDTKNPQPEFAHVAAALQRVTEEIVVGLAKHLREISGEEYLCMTGGVALNSVANGLVLRNNYYRDVCIHPAAHDGGTGLGAALHVYYRHVPDHRTRTDSWWVMEHPYLGMQFSEQDILNAIEAAGFPARKSPDAVRYAAEQLAQGKIVGWYQGKMEVGPRALGNRSILGDPRVPTMKDDINKRVKFREHWRPFAPSVLKEDCGIYFDSDHESPYMLFVYNTKPEMLNKIPAICHVDGTARVQTVDRDTNPRYYRLIEEFKTITGFGVILNTSLNVKGEPIICTPREAVQCFLVGGMDCMILEDYILEKDDLPGTRIFSEYPTDAKLLNIPTRTGRINGFVNIDVPGSDTFDDVKSDLGNLSAYADNSVDLIHSHGYLQTLTLDRVRTVLREWHRVLKENGVLLLEVPGVDYLFSDEEKEKQKRSLDLQNPAVSKHTEMPRTFFNSETLNHILTDCGYRNVELLPCSPFHPEKIGYLLIRCRKPKPEPIAEYEDLRNYRGVSDQEIDQIGSSVHEPIHQVWISRPRTTPEEIASVYAETELYLFRHVYKHYHDYQKRSDEIYEMVRDILEEIGESPLRLLDYGCGSACIHKFLLRLNDIRITLADIPSETFSFAKWRFRNMPNVEFFEIDPARLGLTGTYHVIFCDNVLEHLLNPLEVVQHLTEHLKSRGYALIDFATALGPYQTGHLKASIDQYDKTMRYIREKYDLVNPLLYRKKD